jgi:hypothetical protein
LAIAGVTALLDDEQRHDVDTSLQAAFSVYIMALAGHMLLVWNCVLSIFRYCCCVCAAVMALLYDEQSHVIYTGSALCI